MNTPPENTVSSRFFAPLIAAMAQAKSCRTCPSFTDIDFLRSGVGRVITPVKSGREWVQRIQMVINSTLTVSHFFSSLKSIRRLRLLEEVALTIRKQLDAETTHGRNDPIAHIAELKEFAVYASDGHVEAAATHAKPMFGKIRPVAAFYAINLRTRSLSLLDIARPRGIKTTEHDMPVLKRLGSTVLRMGEPKGTKVIQVYDPAVTDYHAWAAWKVRGLYVITREKANSAAEVQGNLDFDQRDSRNNGVLSDQLVGTGAGYLLRRIVYCDPATETEYRFLTNLLEMPPGIIAFLYKLRWDIEKTFDEKKNKLEEKQAWASGETARAQQAQFICIAYNLMTFLEIQLEEKEGIRDEKVSKRKQCRAEKVESEIVKREGKPNALVAHHRRATQRSLQFIRWLRYCLDSPSAWCQEIELLRPYMQKYIS